MKKTLLLLTILLTIGLYTTIAQQQAIKGKVLDEDHLGIPGVSVLVKGTTLGTITNVDGEYSMNVPKDEILLVFSFIGYKNQEIQIKGRSVINVTLKSEVFGLNEVVAVGYGTQIKSKITGAITSVDTEVLENRPVSSVQEALSGMAPGLIINQSSGTPGDSPLLSIRGESTIGASSGVLVLIDDIEGSISDISPSEIENISVLKDAAAAAIYGARAANGVILITTKSGRKSKKAQVNYSFDIGIQSPVVLPGLVSSVEYMEMKNFALINEESLPEYSETVIEKAKNGELSETDWTDQLYAESAIRTNHYLNVAGGNEKSSYYLGLGALEQDGIVKGSDSFQRYNLRVKLETDLNKRITLGTNTSWINRLKDNVSIDRSRALRAAPFFPVTYEGAYVVGMGGDSFNPVMTSESGSFNKEEQDIFETQLYAKLKLAKDLTFEEKVSFRRNHTNTEVWRNSIDYVTMNLDESGYTDIAPVSSNSEERSLSYRSAKNLRITTQSFLRYKYQKEDHFIEGLLGFQTEENQAESFRAGTYDFLNGSLQDLDLGVAADPGIGQGTGSTSSSSEWSVTSFLGRLNYDYKSKYLAEFSFRYDGTSRFEGANRWGFFPSFSLGWNMKKENFLDEVSFLDILKLRGSWGQLGDAFKVSNYAIYQTVIQNSGYVWSDGSEPGLKIDATANKDITWETATVVNFGIDASFWRGKLGVQTEYYINKRTDILGRPDVAKEFGLTAPSQNERDVKSWGWEMNISHKNKIGKLRYELLFNISDQRNEVTDLGSTKLDISEGYITDKGYAIDSRYGYRSNGLITSQEDLDDYLGTVSLEGLHSPYIGSVKLKDISGPDGLPDGTIDPKHDREVFDDNQSHYRIGGRISLNYEGFSLIAIIDGVLDKDVYFSGGQSEIPFSGGVATPFAFQRGAFDPTSPDAYAVMPIIKPELVRYDISDYWLRKASYVRMRNISLSYDLSKTLLKHSKYLEKASVYASVENPFMIWTNYFAYKYGWDPQLPPGEVHENQKGMRPVGAGVAQYPLARTISFGINLSF